MDTYIHTSNANSDSNRVSKQINKRRVDMEPGIIFLIYLLIGLSMVVFERLRTKQKTTVANYIVIILLWP